jgi:NAD+ synthase
MEFDRHALDLDTASTADRLCNWIREQLRGELKKTGAVVGISGGIDSAVVAALCVRALGPERVLGVALPEHESESVSEQLARDLSGHFGFELITQEISSGLSGLHCYERRDEAIRQVFPEFEDSWTAKITNSGSILDKDTFNFFHLTVQDREGRVQTRRIPSRPYLQIVAASNLKQRLRMAALYYFGESCNRAVIGTANRDEFGQGFFVKYGDGGADMHPLVRLFKTQVFQLGRYLDVPDAILDRPPTTDTYSADVSQEEFYYGLDFDRMDLITHAMETGVPVERVAEVLELEPVQIERASANIMRKRTATAYLRSSPLAVVGSEETTPIDPVLAEPVRSRS